MTLNLTQLSGFGGGGPFSPFANTYTTGTGATETIPGGATTLLIEIWAPGGGGGDGGTDPDGAGGGGAYCAKTVSIVASGGKTLTYTVTAGAVHGTGTTSGDCTVVNGTFSTSVNMTAHAGGAVATTNNPGGGGGTATGGDTNTSGSAGISGGNSSTPTGGNNNGPGGGTGGTAGVHSGANAGNGNPPGGGGGGGGGGGSIGGNGGTGQIRFNYS